MSEVQHLHPFDQATAVRACGPAFIAVADSPYWTFAGPFGGAVAASLLRACLASPERRGEPVALTVNFAAPLERGEYVIETALTRATKTTQHWRIEAFQGSESAPRITGSAIFAERRESWLHQSASVPHLPPITELPAFDASRTVPWVGCYQHHFAAGAPVIGEPGSAFSLSWLSDAPKRTIDVLSLAAMSDAFFGRIFQVMGAVVPCATVSLTTYFHSDAAELDSLSIDNVVARADARRFHKSYGDQTGELWSPNGRLLATSHQIINYRA